MATIAVSTPHFRDRITQAEDIVANRHRSPDLVDEDRTLLAGTLADLRRSLGDRGATEQLLHGEPHPGNVLATADGPVFIDLETCCRGPVEFDIAHAPEAVAEHHPGVDRALLDDCRQLVVALVAAWRWDVDDEFPDGRWFGLRLLDVLRTGPPWPSVDAVLRRPGAPEDDVDPLR